MKAVDYRVQLATLFSIAHERVIMAMVVSGQFLARAEKPCTENN
jgi:hypothetical protein